MTWLQGATIEKSCLFWRLPAGHDKIPTYNYSLLLFAINQFENWSILLLKFGLRYYIMMVDKERNYMKRLSKAELTRTIGFTLRPTDVAKLDAIAGGRGRSSFIRHLIEKAWAEYTTKEQA